ncbi:MAG: aspartate kinase [Deltaproteobacteria bacterium]|nr:aspartate kinase [Deltaproteobacteria bacterium]
MSTDGRPLIVQKYGGSSVASLERIRGCAQRCLATAAGGARLVVVVSAMAGETNRLIALANALVHPEAEGGARKGPYVAPAKHAPEHARELDQLVATGEVVSAALLAMAIQDAGGTALSLVGAQLGLHTDRSHGRARIVGVDAERLLRELDRGAIVVCAGFQGTDDAGDVTTLGRGGSDTSAVALAAALAADTCEILTDVDGVYTTDPNVVPTARKIARLSCEEMLELAGQGAKVLQIRSVELAMRYGVPVHVRTSFDDRPGTMIVPEEPQMESVLVSGVALERNEAKLTLVGVPDVPGVVATIFASMAALGIVVDMIIQNAGANGRADVTFTVPEADLDRAAAALAAVQFGDAAPSITTDRDICKISIVGLGMRTHAGVAAKAFAILAGESINVQMVSTSEIKISVVVHERYGELALRALHDGFGLGGAAT